MLQPVTDPCCEDRTAWLSRLTRALELGMWVVRLTCDVCWPTMHQALLKLFTIEGKVETGEITYPKSQGQEEVSLAAAGPLLTHEVPYDGKLS